MSEAKPVRERRRSRNALMSLIIKRKRLPSDVLGNLFRCFYEVGKLFIAVLFEVSYLVDKTFCLFVVVVVS